MASLTLIRRVALALFCTAMIASVPFAFHAAAQAPRAAEGHARVPVLIELFTSEGCSDCPPADRLLEELDTKQFVPGAEAIVLSEHVTYWNRLGWRDPFSLDEADERQRIYGERFNLESVYTPQAVIDGSVQLVGNNAADLANAVEHAASSQKTALAIADVHWENGAVTFAARGAADSGSRLFAVVAADGTSPKIVRGENAGRTLHHVAVVRSIKEFSASALDGRALRISTGNLSQNESTARLRLVVFLVDRKTGHVHGVSEQSVPR